MDLGKRRSVNESLVLSTSSDSCSCSQGSLEVSLEMLSSVS